jgi:hypothetical protein
MNAKQLLLELSILPPYKPSDDLNTDVKMIQDENGGYIELKAVKELITLLSKND